MLQRPRPHRVSAALWRPRRRYYLRIVGGSIALVGARPSLIQVGLHLLYLRVDFVLDRPFVTLKGKLAAHRCAPVVPDIPELSGFFTVGDKLKDLIGANIAKKIL